MEIWQFQLPLSRFRSAIMGNYFWNTSDFSLKYLKYVKDLKFGKKYIQIYANIRQIRNEIFYIFRDIFKYHIAIQCIRIGNEQRFTVCPFHILCILHMSYISVYEKCLLHRKPLGFKERERATQRRAHTFQFMQYISISMKYITYSVKNGGWCVFLMTLLVYLGWVWTQHWVVKWVEIIANY